MSMPHSLSARKAAPKPRFVCTIAGSRSPLSKTEPSRHSLPVVSEEMSQSICRICGLCCDGTLFGRVPLDPTEIAAMSKLGFDIVQAGHPPHLPQPCPKLVERSCSVYEKRPQNCRGYRCRVLQRLESGELDLAKAQASIHRARSLIATCTQLLPTIGDPSGGIWTWLEEFVGAKETQIDDVQIIHRNSRLEECALSLRRHLDEEFKPQKLPGDEI